MVSCFLFSFTDPAPTAIYTLSLHDALPICREMVKPYLALYIGGMGSRERNFYNQLVQRYGYVEEARTIQDLYLAGDRSGAAAAVPDGLVDATSVLGSPEQCAEGLRRLDAAGVTMPVLGLNALTAADRHRMLE